MQFSIIQLCQIICAGKLSNSTVKISNTVQKLIHQVNSHPLPPNGTSYRHYHPAFHSDPFFYNCILKCNINTGSSNNNSHARTTSSKLNLLLWNARSLNKQINDFQSFVYSETFDIIAITETWLTNNIYTNEIFPSGYTVLRKDRDSRDCLPSKTVST